MTQPEIKRENTLNNYKDTKLDKELTQKGERGRKPFISEAGSGYEFKSQMDK